MNNKGFSKLEMIIVIVVCLVVIIGGLLLAINLTNSAKADKLKDIADIIVGDGKNAYVTLEKTDKTEYILNNDYSSTCFTIKGLIKNNILSSDYDKYEGYVVIEKKDKEYITSIWLTNKEYMINGYEAKKIKDLSYKKGIEDYDNSVDFNKINGYKSASSENGGTGLDYHGSCIDDKLN